MKKRFAIPAEEMKQLVAPMGGCFITDRVTVDGLEIGYMYREQPDRPEDSGWRFFSGDESQEYIDDLTHTGVYEVNTAANYDPDMIPYLETPAPCAFEKVAGTHEYERVDEEMEGDSEDNESNEGAAMLHPGFPIVEGSQQMTENWAVTLPSQFNRRIEDESLVFWRPGMTIWTTVWNNDQNETMEERLEWLRANTSRDAFEAEVINEGDIIRYAYRLTEDGDEGIVHTLSAFAFGANGHVQMAIYFDDETDVVTAREIWRSLEDTREF